MLCDMFVTMRIPVLALLVCGCLCVAMVTDMMLCASLFGIDLIELRGRRLLKLCVA